MLRAADARALVIADARCFHCGKPASARGESLMTDNRSLGVFWYVCAAHYAQASEASFDTTGVSAGFVFEGEEVPGARGPAYDYLAGVLNRTH